MWSISWLFVLEAVVIVTGNIITIVVFTTTPRLRSRQYVLIVSLAVADLLVGLVSLPLNIVFDEYSEVRSIAGVYGTVYFVQDYSLGAASLLGLSALALERTHATYFPFKHNTLSTVAYIVGIAVVWLLAVILGAASYVCYQPNDLDLDDFTLLKIITVSASLIVITASYLLIFVNVRCMATASNPVNNQGNKKLTVTLSIVTIISLVTWMPHPIIVSNGKTIIRLSSLNTFFFVRSISKVFHYSNSLANFVIYAFRMREFKKEILRRIRCGVRYQVTPSNGIELGNMSTKHERRS